MVLRLEPGATLGEMVHLGALDLMVLSGTLDYPHGPLAGRWGPGTWGYIPANARVAGLRTSDGVEMLANAYGPLAFLAANGRGIQSLLTALDVRQLAHAYDITLVPSTLAECLQPRPPAYQGPSEPLAIATGDARALVTGTVGADQHLHPHFVDTRAVPWLEFPDMPDLALKILRISEETGVVSLIVRHNGVAGPHYHLGAGDFLVLSGRIGYRAGPPEGYGPGVWFYEPAGARHDATQRVSDEDLIYTANVYGPVQFDSGRGTPIVAVQSWMQYREMADAAGIPLVRSTFEGDASLLAAWQPLGGPV
ncbi:MAG: hypothetical protein R3E84_16080 [Pseudomonadales bacterium]